MLYCVSVVGGGGGRDFWLVVGRGPALHFSVFLRVLLSVLVVSPGGLPEWGHDCKLGLGSGCSGYFGYPVGFVRRSVSGSTI